jgi:integrase
MRGDGRIFPRGNWLYIAYQFNGEEQREPAKDKNNKNTNDPKVALAYLRERQKEVHADELGARSFVTPRAAKITVRELIAELRLSLELDGKLSGETLCHLNRAEKDFGDFRAARLTAPQVDAYIKTRLADGARPATVNRVLVYLRQAFALAKKREILNRSPFIKHMNEDDGIRREFFSETEIAAIIEALPADLRDFTRWCATCGMRKGEASKLTWDMVRGDELHVPGTITKNGDPRTLPIPGELAAILRTAQSG